MRTVLKYPLPDVFDFTLDLPRDCTIRSLQVQAGRPCLWVEVDPNEARVETRTFKTYGTGAPMPDGLYYVGTYLVADGALVWHVYETE